MNIESRHKRQEEDGEVEQEGEGLRFGHTMGFFGGRGTFLSRFTCGPIDNGIANAETGEL